MTTTASAPGTSPGIETGTAPTAPGDRDGLLSRLGRLQSRFPVAQLFITIAAFVFGAATLNGFASPNSVKTVLILSALVALAGLGQTLVILVGGIDMSVANFLVVGAVVVTQLTVTFNMPFGVAVLVLIPTTLILGGLVGWVCHRFEVEPLVVTLAMGTFALGLVQVQTEGMIAGGAPEWLMALTSLQSTTFGLPIPPILVIWALAIVVMAVFIHRTTAGRRLLVTGANARAAQYSLVKVRRIWVVVFALSAMLAALAGIALAAFSGTVNTSIGGPYLFQSLAAVIIGGTALGGPGDYTRTVIGAVMLTVITTVLIGHGLGEGDQQILSGLIILVAMVIYGRGRKLSDRV
ncbi:ribose ABC transporter permease [Pseudoclavibacter endophyticus]|uniref:ABC transporter permease n=1 Tax=Pseudoclavibacter endophyticus TaxID=1778590 RepID=A0A6H9WN60_9MICO|nr:ABC transporter permease [Pseudoclavibacter endophyticus]KAB1646675.1 ABC transporter permease [Pseudoclavibacter endophyticus]GGA76584.1 ribose ABC transporter permease [Pseudoclavibacter endophyticus]